MRPKCQFQAQDIRRLLAGVRTHIAGVRIQEALHATVGERSQVRVLADLNSVVQSRAVAACTHRGAFAAAGARTRRACAAAGARIQTACAEAGGRIHRARTRRARTAEARAYTDDAGGLAHNAQAACPCERIPAAARIALAAEGLAHIQPSRDTCAY